MVLPSICVDQGHQRVSLTSLHCKADPSQCSNIVAHMNQICRDAFRNALSLVEIWHPISVMSGRRLALVVWRLSSLASLFSTLIAVATNARTVKMRHQQYRKVQQRRPCRQGSGCCPQANSEYTPGMTLKRQKSQQSSGSPSTVLVCS